MDSEIAYQQSGKPFEREVARLLVRSFFTSCPKRCSSSPAWKAWELSKWRYNLMKCKQTREVIDTASRHTMYSDTVTTHLSGCPDCRLHADGTASLLTLLSAQPRAQAPADFDFRLSAGIAIAQAERLSDKTASLLNLLKAQPRVESPADFDFRLSAGIARAQAERLSPASVLE